MRKQSINKTEEMYLQIPFHAWIDGDMEILKEMYDYDYPNAAAIERIKQFIISDFATNIQEYEKVSKNENNDTTSILDDMPF